jgi:ferredoxin
LLLIFWLYEAFDLWVSPLLTAWLVLAYFISALALELAFAESPFCKYVCPLGAFNFTYATASPLQISARSGARCRQCPGKECQRGAPDVVGCGTELYVPMMRSNWDCTLCLDCVRACPYDNVSIIARPALAELVDDRWPKRWDIAFLVVSLGFLGLANAFGMVSPVYAVRQWMFKSLGIASDALRVALVLGVGGLVMPALALFGGAWLSERLTTPVHRPSAQLQIASRYAPAFVPMGLGIWLAHYGFHFAIGGLTIIPVAQTFLLDHGLAWLVRAPFWNLSFLLPQDWIFPLQVIAILIGFLAALLVAGWRALAAGLPPNRAFLQMLPWAICLAILAFAALSVFNLPMEMRGTLIMGGTAQ